MATKKKVSRATAVSRSVAALNALPTKAAHPPIVFKVPKPMSKKAKGFDRFTTERELDANRLQGLQYGTAERLKGLSYQDTLDVRLLLDNLDVLRQFARLMGNIRR